MPNVAVLIGVVDLVVPAENDEGRLPELIFYVVDLQADFRILPHPLDFFPHRRKTEQALRV